MGLTVDLEALDKDAHCGLHGACEGDVDFHVQVHRPAEGTELECALEREPGSVQHTVCNSAVNGSAAVCSLAMPPTLSPGEKLGGFCRIVKTEDKIPVTKDAPFFIYNHHPAPPVPAPSPAPVKLVKKTEAEPVAKGGVGTNSPFSFVVSIAVAFTVAAFGL